MKLSSKAQQLTELITPAVHACGVELWGIEFRPQGNQSLLRIYIDVSKTDTDTGVSADNEEQDDKPKSVSVNQCKMVSHQVSGLLDVHDPIAGEFLLEVSSPGWDRQFFQLEQMQDYIGQTVSLRLIHAMHNRRKFVTKLVAVTENSIQVELVEKNITEIVEISTNNIDKANLVFQN